LTVLPGKTLGILGGGQLARMLAIAARPLGYHVVVLDPDGDCPAAPVSDRVVVGAYDDAAALDTFAGLVDVVTLEFENVPSAALVGLEERVPLRPGRWVLGTARDRRLEKRFLEEAGVPIAPWAQVASPEDFAAALERVPLPGILKTATLGYDGKGQHPVAARGDLPLAFQALGSGPCVLEGRVEFERELSVIVARSPIGEVAVYPPFENRHVDGILDATTWPAAVPATVAQEATRLARTTAEALELCGLLCVEFFATADGRVLANEMAPRPHNSGHLTIEAAVTSQFEQAVRAACGLSLGTVEARSPAAMVNLLGDLWQHGEPDWTKALEMRGVKLHLYGKCQARPGRKMGHLTALAGSAPEALAIALAAREAVTIKK
jgi:5-(carboxyamino)imidazole ribonucleotide synthase